MGLFIFFSVAIRPIAFHAAEYFVQRFAKQPKCPCYACGRLFGFLLLLVVLAPLSYFLAFILSARIFWFYILPRSSCCRNTGSVSAS
jgi:hypothetical protein